MASPKADMILEAVRRIKQRECIMDAVSSFYVFRTDTNRILARGLVGYDAAKDAANQIRKKYGLKWDQVSFKKERSFQSQQRQKTMGSSSGYKQGRRIYGYRTAKGHWKDWDE